MSGPPPKPTGLKRLTGNPGKRALPKHEPKPRAGRPACPSWLPAEARREWRRIVPELEAMGVLTRADGSALMGYCLAVADVRAAQEVLDSEGTTYTTASGYVAQRPEVSMKRQALAQMKAFLTEFGLTPASRTRITATPKTEVLDPLEELRQRVHRSAS